MYKKPSTNLIRIFLFLFLFELGSFSPLFVCDASAQRNNSDIAAKLKATKEKMLREQEHLKSLKEEVLSLEKKVKKAQAKLEEIAEAKSQLARAIENLQYEGEELEQLIADTKVLSENRRKQLSDRIVATYKMYRRSSMMDVVVQSSGTTNLLQRAYLLSRISAYDQEHLLQLANLLDEFYSDKERLREIQEQKKTSIEKYSKIEVKLERAKINHGKFLAQATRKAGEQEVVVAKLEISARDLERLLGRIMGGEPSSTLVTRDESRGDGEDTFIGAGLGARKGNLIFPVKGELVQRYGKQRHKSFDDVLFVKGVEVNSALGSSVRAVAKGKIVLKQVLPGYGNVIVIDHGHRFYTLYGRLAGSLRSVGDLVEEGEELAIIGEADERGRNFYFELRIKGVAVDPIAYFKDKPKLKTS